MNIPDSGKTDLCCIMLFSLNFLSEMHAWTSLMSIVFSTHTKKYLLLLALPGFSWGPESHSGQAYSHSIRNNQ